METILERLMRKILYAGLPRRLRVPRSTITKRMAAKKAIAKLAKKVKASPKKTIKPLTGSAKEQRKQIIQRGNKAAEAEREKMVDLMMLRDYDKRFPGRRTPKQVEATKKEIEKLKPIMEGRLRHIQELTKQESADPKMDYKQAFMRGVKKDYVKNRARKIAAMRRKTDKMIVKQNKGEYVPTPWRDDILALDKKVTSKKMLGKKPPGSKKTIKEHGKSFMEKRRQGRQLGPLVVEGKEMSVAEELKTRRNQLGRMRSARKKALVEARIKFLESKQPKGKK